MGGFEQSALDSLADPVAFHNNQGFPLDQAMWNGRRYADYVLACANKAISINAGRAPNTDWPTIPFEVGSIKSPDGYLNAEPGKDGPRTLDQVDAAKYPVIAAPADETVSRSLTGRQAGMGNPAGTMVLGQLIPGTSGIYQALPGDTCVEGTTKTIPGPGGSLIKLRKHTTPWGGMWETVS